MTYAKRRRRGLTSKSHCKACQGFPEDLDHVFRFYEKYIIVWRGFINETDKRKL